MRDEIAIKRARKLRHTSSPAERICWELLRDRRNSGVKFRRQYPIGPYFADFACLSKKLVVEIDGEHHAYQKEADARRTAVMARAGWRVIRFWANEIRENREGVWSAIKIVLDQVPDAPPHLTSPPRGRGI